MEKAAHFWVAFYEKNNFVLLNKLRYLKIKKMREEFKHIISTPEILGGKPCIRGTRISVQLILEWIGNGANVGEIVKQHPLLTKEAVEEAVKYAAHFGKNDLFFDFKLAG